VIREIDVKEITAVVKELSITANKTLPEDIVEKIAKAKCTENNTRAKSILCDMEKNIDISAKNCLPLCQDTGMVVVFLEVGQDVHFTGGLLSDAVNEGVRQGYEEGLLRKSVVADPIERVNTNDNTPAVIHTELVAGDRVKVTVAPKGFGSENMSGVKMLTPFDGYDGVKKAVLQSVKDASNNPCPPMVVGVGIGGTMEKAAIMAKHAVAVSAPAKDEAIAKLEEIDGVRKVRVI
jgi:fumarate hydratase subunit alpha